MKSSKTIFFNAVKTAPYYWLKMMKTQYVYMAILYGTVISFSGIAHYVSQKHSIFALLIPLLIHFCCLAMIAINALFVAPYFVQKTLNQEGDKYFCQLPKSFFLFFKENAYSWAKEMSKVMTVSYLWGLLLFIPGILKFIRCTFVSYITLFDANYKIKKFSVIKASSSMTKGLMKWFLLSTFLSVVLSYPFSYWVQSMDIGLFSGGLMLAKGMEYGWTLASCFFLSVVYHLIYLQKNTQYHVLPSRSYESHHPIAL